MLVLIMMKSPNQIVSKSHQTKWVIIDHYSIVHTWGN